MSTTSVKETVKVKKLRLQFDKMINVANKKLTHFSLTRAQYIDYCSSLSDDAKKQPIFYRDIEIKCVSDR